MPFDISKLWRSKPRCKIGLALSGGAARGMTHLGVIKALYERDIRPDYIAGTSAGAIVAAFIADGYEPDELLDIFMEKKILMLMRINFGKAGLLKMTGVRGVMEKYLRARNIEDLKIPIYITCTNLYSGMAEYFNRGEIIEKLLASSSLPGLFAPIQINGSLFVDGGIVDNLPVKPLLKKCNKIIGVDVNYTGPVDKIESAVEVLERSFHLSIRAKIEEKAKKCDLFIDPDELSDFGLTDIARGREMFDIGYRKAKKLLKGKKIFN
jgi:NTE family protein